MLKSLERVFYGYIELASRESRDDPLEKLPAAPQGYGRRYAKAKCFDQMVLCSRWNVNVKEETRPELETRRAVMAWVADRLTLLEEQIGDDAATLESWVDNAELIDEAFRVEGQTTKLAMMFARVSCVRSSIRSLKNALTTNPKLTQYERHTNRAAADSQNQSG